MEYHSRAKTKKPKADAKSISSSRTLAGQSGDRERKREGGENGDRERKREGGENGDRERKRQGGENGDRERKGGDRLQQQAAGCEGGESSGLARGAAARRRRGQDDDATIAATRVQCTK